jgi:AraC-like DNA-binding protein
LLSDLVTPADKLIECPDSRRTVQPFELASGTHRHGGQVTSQLHALRRACLGGTATPGWLEERLQNLLVNMVSVHRTVLAEIESIGAVKLSTRIELHLRLSVARDFIECNFSRYITLDDIAREACLSPFHLLRLFKQVFGATPHQYLTNLRLTRAKYLLSTSDLLVTDICILVGFESLGSFSWLFRKRFGMPPTAYRSSCDAEPGSPAL